MQFHATGNGTVHVIADLAGYHDPSATDFFEPLAPRRVTDTRRDRHAQRHRIRRSGTGGNTEHLSDSQTTPFLGDAAVYNLTETAPTGSGFLTVFEGDSPLPNASDISFAVNQTRANLVIVLLDRLIPDGALNVYNGGSSGQVQFIMDLGGIFNAESHG